MIHVSTLAPIVCDSIAEARRLKAEGKTVLHLSQLSQDDMDAIYFLAQGVAADLVPLFLAENRQAQPVEPVSDQPNDAHAG